jgi:hypothetical protein
MVRPYIKLINVLLFILVVFLINRIYNIWRPSEAKDFSEPTKERQAVVPVPKLNISKKPPRKAYQNIINKDLFRPQRNEWKPPSIPEQEIQTTELKIRVYGIVMYDKLKYAWIKEEVKRVKGSRSRRRLKKTKGVKSEKLKKIEEGDSIEGWLVSTIKPDAVILKLGENNKEFHLIEPGDPKRRVLPKRSHIKKHKPKVSQRKFKNPTRKRNPSAR